jgi:hypothetical protein
MTDLEALVVAASVFADECVVVAFETGIPRRDSDTRLPSVLTPDRATSLADACEVDGYGERGESVNTIRSRSVRVMSSGCLSRLLDDER